MQHKQVPVKHWRYGIIYVDEGMFPMLKTLWSLGIDTDISCQENPSGMMWIVFTDADSLELFLNVIANADQEFYYHYIEAPEGRWSLDVCPWNQSEYLDEEADEIKRHGPPDITFSVSVRFPASQHDRILEALKKKLDEKMGTIRSTDCYGPRYKQLEMVFEPSC